MCCFNKVNLSAILLVRKRLINEDCTVKNHNEMLLEPDGSSWAGVAQSVQRLSTGWTVRGSNPGGRRDFPHPSTPVLGPTQPPLQMVPGLSRGLKLPGFDVDPLPSNVEVKEKAEMYICSPSGSSRPVMGWTFTLALLDLMEGDNLGNPGWGRNYRIRYSSWVKRLG